MNARPFFNNCTMDLGRIALVWNEDPFQWCTIQMKQIIDNSAVFVEKTRLHKSGNYESIHTGRWMVEAIEAVTTTTTTATKGKMDWSVTYQKWQYTRLMVMMERSNFVLGTPISTLSPASKSFLNINVKNNNSTHHRRRWTSDSNHTVNPIHTCTCRSNIGHYNKMDRWNQRCC